MKTQLIHARTHARTQYLACKSGSTSSCRLRQAAPLQQPGAVEANEGVWLAEAGHLALSPPLYCLPFKCGSGVRISHVTRALKARWRSERSEMWREDGCLNAFCPCIKVNSLYSSTCISYLIINVALATRERWSSRAVWRLRSRAHRGF